MQLFYFLCQLRGGKHLIRHKSYRKELIFFFKFHNTLKAFQLYHRTSLLSLLINCIYGLSSLRTKRAMPTHLYLEICFLFHQRCVQQRKCAHTSRPRMLFLNTRARRRARSRSRQRLKSVSRFFQYGDRTNNF